MLKRCTLYGPDGILHQTEDTNAFEPNLLALVNRYPTLETLVYEAGTDIEGNIHWTEIVSLDVRDIRLGRERL